MSTFDILISSYSGLIKPIIIIVINTSLNFLVYQKFDTIGNNFMIITLSILMIIFVTIYKRRIDELNRKCFIQQYIFKKYYLYYYDLINNINGFHFSLRSDSLIKINNNLKIFFNNIEETSINENTNFNLFKPLITCQLEENQLINKKKNENENYLNNDKHINDLNLNCTYKNINNKNINKLNDIRYLNQKTQNIMKLMNIKNIDTCFDIDYLKKKLNNFYDVYELIKEREFNNIQISSFPEKDTKLFDILNFYKKDSNKNDEENFIINRIINFENESPNVNKFKLIGEFEFDLDKKIFQVFYRNLKEYDNIIDFALYDITDIKEAERIKAENQIKSKFFAKIAHEFKTPINCIIALLKNIKKKLEIISNISIDKDNIYSTTQKNHVFSEINLAESLSNYTIFLINDIIDYSMSYQKINYEINIENVNIKDVIKFCKNILTSLLISKEKDKHIKIFIDYDPIIEANNYIIYSDPFRLKQILLNFISNSVKFTKSGYIKLKTEIKVKEKEINNIDIENSINDNNNILKISVIDSGLGLNDEEINNIFNDKKNFSKKDYNKEGSGLGLIICKNIADMLKHKMEVSSILDNGSEFSINLECQILNTSKKNHIFNTVNRNSSQESFSKYEIDIDDINSRINKRSYYPNNEVKDTTFDKNRFFQPYIDIDKSSNLQNISVDSSSSQQTRIISKLNLNLCKEKFSIFESKDDLYINKKELSKFKSKDDFNLDISIKQKITIFDNYKKINRSCINTNLKQITYIENNDKDNLHSIERFVTKEIFQYKKINNIIDDMKSQNSYSMNNYNFQSNDKNLIISGIDINKEINNKETNNFYKNNQDYNKKEHFLLKKKILVVDDHKILRDTIVFLLKKCIKLSGKENEFEIIEGKDGIDILYYIINDQHNNNLIKCVITDENMEYLNGSEAIQIIRNMEKNKKIKNVVIASISAFHDEFTISKIKSSGTNQILQKPCTEKNMKDFLKEYKIL